MQILSASARDRIKSLLPTPLLYLARRHSVGKAQNYDRSRYLKFSSSIRPETSRENLSAWITMLYHNIEKGLSLPEPRPGFGATAVKRLVTNVTLYIQKYQSDEITEFAISALNSYQDFNLRSGLTPADIPCFEEITRLVSSQPSRDSGGSRTVSREEQERTRGGVTMQFFTSRSSVRQYSDEPISDEVLQSAVCAAQKSPAVCNRQFSKVYFSREPRTIEEALRIQGGARGFSTNVPAIAVITTSNKSYWNAEERMQPWTDGGMFAMSFVLALHALGLGSVCLNWSKTPKVDREFRRRFNIESDEVIVMLVAFGHLKESYEVAESPRIDTAKAFLNLNINGGPVSRI